MAVNPFTYSGDPAASNLDAARFYIGDTDCRRPLLNDNEINFALAQYPSPAGAAVMLLEQLGTRFAREADFTAGQVSKSFSQIASAYQDRADRLRAQNNRSALPFFGGQSWSAKQALASSSDAVQPHFAMGQFDNPSVLQFDQVYPLLGKLGFWNV